MHIVLSESDPLAADDKPRIPAQAAALIKTRAGVATPVEEADVQQLVGRSVPGLTPEAVAVVVTGLVPPIFRAGRPEHERNRDGRARMRARDDDGAVRGGRRAPSRNTKNFSKTMRFFAFDCIVTDVEILASLGYACKMSVVLRHPVNPSDFFYGEVELLC